MRKLTYAAAGLALALALSACSGGSGNPASTSTGTGSAGTTGQSASDVTLTFMSNVVGAQADALATIVKAFTAQTGINVDFSSPGADYESLMATKMASGDMPDVFTTHGWSVLRYADFLTPVNDQPFFSRITPQIKSVISAVGGDVYVLPVDEDIAGLVYNVDVLNAAGVDPASLTTWAKFTDALGKIAATGVTPLHVGGKDSWTIGQFGDWIAPSFFVTNDASNQRAALTGGTFDAATWEQVAQLLSDWVKAGYFNVDSMTADYAADAASIAQGTSAFGFYGNGFIVDAHGTNPNANLGMMPIPAATDADTPSLIAGEKLAVGVWKDSAHKDAAFQLLNFLAQDANVKTLAEASGNPAGLTGVTPDLGKIQTYLDKYATVRTFPYFDRAYLPNGMWDVMCATGADILTQKDNAVTAAGQTMAQNFADKYQG
ncbi:MAG: extracellular solute-binding protein [Propionibacteriaceae bacterium]|jgi:raffinose/stachyose/melibiose transport system substrate-binding protein|nr:extracellular solute-binding protein [Propionibacteriaceae bacterium]